MNYTKIIKDSIEKKKGRRNIILWGGWNEKTLVNDILGTSEEKANYVSTQMNMVKSYDGKEEIKHISIIDGKAKEYFVIAFPKQTTETDKMFNKYGFSSKDVFYVRPKTKIIRKSYEDDYGNKVSDLPLNCEIILEGFNNKISIDMSCKCLHKLRIICTNNVHIEIHPETVFSDEFDIIAKDLTQGEKDSQLIIKSGSSFSTGSCTLYNGEILIGNHCTFGRNLRIASCYGMHVNIKDDCMFSHDIFLLGGDAHAIYDVETELCINALENLSNERTSICLEEHVWVGLKTVIMNGSKIGDGSIVGAMSLVKGTFPNNCILAGNPARIIKKNISWSRRPIPKNGTIADCGQYINQTMLEENET